MQKIDGKVYNLMIPDEMLERIDRFASRHGLRRAQAMRNLMEVGLTVHSDFERIGVIKIVEVWDRLKRILRKETQPGLFET